MKSRPRPPADISRQRRATTTADGKRVRDRQPSRRIRRARPSEPRAEPSALKEHQAGLEMALEAANTALREREEQYESLLNRLNVGVYRRSLGPRARIRHANPAMARLSGYDSVDELLRVPLRDFYANPAESKVLPAEIMAHGAVHGHQVRMKRKDGTPFWASINAILHRDADGRALWIDGIVEDISDRKRAESLLQVQRDLSIRLGSTSDLETALAHLLEVVTKVDGIDCGGTYLVDGATGALELVTSQGVSRAFAAVVSHLSADSPQARLVQQGQVLFTQFSQLPIPLNETRLREGIRVFCLVPLIHENRPIGALVAGSHTSDETPIQTRVTIETLAAQASGALARIRAEAERRSLERQILEISDRERTRLGHDIHDGLCQELVILAFHAVALEQRFAGVHPSEAALASKLAGYVDKAITESRRLAHGLFPVRLEAEGLSAALEELAGGIGTRFPVDCRFICQPPVWVPGSPVTTHLYRIAEEAVNNALKHGAARAIVIRLRVHGGQLELEVEDDGVGIRSQAGAGRKGMGLHIMDYRTRSIGGTLRIAPGPRGGTTVTCRMPWPADRSPRALDPLREAP